MGVGVCDVLNVTDTTLLLKSTTYILFLICTIDDFKMVTVGTLQGRVTSASIIECLCTRVS
jgi:hypothetical protein